jgi:purine catabolism regulator
MVGLSSMDGCHILTDQCSMNGEILRATVVEDTNLGKWAQPGDAVICSGYPFHAHMDLFYTALEQLSKTGAVALCIKAVRNKPFPAEAIALANAIDLLIVELPREAVFANVIQEISEKILDIKAATFSMLQTQTESLLEILFRENVLEDCFLHIEQFIGNPVIAFATNGKLYMSRETRALFSAEDQAELFRVSLQQRQNTQSEQTVAMGGREIVFDFIEICITGDEPLLLGIPEWNRQNDELDFLALKRIGKFLAVEVKNASTVEKVQRRQEDTLINDLFSGEFANDSDVVAAAASYNYHLERNWKYRIAIINRNTHMDGLPESLNIVGFLQGAREYLDIDAIVTFYAGDIVLMFCNGSEASVLNRFLKLYSNFVGNDRAQVYLSGATSLVGIPAALEQSRHIAAICERCDMPDKIVTTERLGVLWLLNLLPRDVTVMDFVNRQLNPLKTYDSEHKSNLLQTLEIYLNCGCNAMLAAQSLFAHYNTVTYRLDKVQTLLGVDLKDNETRLQLQIALKLDRLLA